MPTSGPFPIAWWESVQPHCIYAVWSESVQCERCCKWQYEMSLFLLLLFYVNDPIGRVQVKIDALQPCSEVLISSVFGSVRWFTNSGPWWQLLDKAATEAVNEAVTGAVWQNAVWVAATSAASTTNLIPPLAPSISLVWYCAVQTPVASFTPFHIDCHISQLYEIQLQLQLQF